MQLEHMVRWSNRTLVMRDVAGEHFGAHKFPIEQTPYLLHVPTTLMMISIADLKKQNSAQEGEIDGERLKNQNFTMDELMSSFIHTLMKNDRDYGKVRRKVVVVLSKADQIKEELPEKLRRYLEEDPIEALINTASDDQGMSELDMEKYMLHLGEISNEIQAWVKNYTEGGSTLIALAKNENIELRFTLVSSTGRPVRADNNQLDATMNPIRVLDPLFWALEFQSKPEK
jgi:hypothetical protein